jgi:GDP-L-fucose synthase
MAEPEVLFPLRGRKVFVAGHRGMAGMAITKRLEREDCEIVTAGRDTLDLSNQAAVADWMAENKPDAVFIAAALVGGILANSTRPAEFLHDNLVIETNLIHSAWKTGVKKLFFLGSSCIYPREAPQPMREESLLTGPLEPTNEWYALAKIAGIKMCQAYRKQYGCDFISAMPTNLYGPGDRYNLAHGHVVAAMIMKVHTAKARGDDSVELWGTGLPKREFLFSDDMADGCIFMMKHYSDALHLNIGTGKDTTIRELAETVGQVVGWHGTFSYDTSKPEGPPRKVMDVSRMAALGWTAGTDLKTGLRIAYDWYVKKNLPYSKK